MKRLLLIVALFLVFAGAKLLAGGETTTYIKTDNQVYIGEDIKFGLFSMKIISSDGMVTKVPNSDVKAYMYNSKLYEYLPVACEKGQTVCYEMMEYVTSKSDLNLYRLGSFDTRNVRYEYYVYKAGKFHLKIDEKNARTVLPFFGLKVV